MARTRTVVLIAALVCCASGAPPVDTPPSVLHGVPPASTAGRISWHVGATALARVDVDAQGTPLAVRVLNAPGFGLEAVTEKALMTWRFRPALHDGKPVPGTAFVAVPFGHSDYDPYQGLSNAPMIGHTSPYQGVLLAALEAKTGRKLLQGANESPRDPATARLLFEDSARLGNDEARASLGEMCLLGHDGPQDTARGISLIRLAAGHHVPLAEYDLGTIYAEGRFLPQDRARAIAWYRRAARADWPQAAYRIAVLYENDPAHKDGLRRAIPWYIQAAQGGIPESQARLGRLYASGLGVKKDLPEAYYWLTLAAGQGDEAAAREASNLAGSLPPSQRAKIATRAASFQPSPMHPHPVMPGMFPIPE